MGRNRRARAKADWLWQLPVSARPAPAQVSGTRSSVLLDEVRARSRRPSWPWGAWDRVQETEALTFARSEATVSGWGRGRTVLPESRKLCLPPEGAEGPGRGLHGLAASRTVCVSGRSGDRASRALHPGERAWCPRSPVGTASEVAFSLTCGPWGGLGASWSLKT